MTLTAPDYRTPMQRIADDQEARRKPVREFLTWVAEDFNRPTYITPADLLPLSAKVGYTVELAQLDSALDAMFTASLYLRSPGGVEVVQRRLDARVDHEIDLILDVTRCEACASVIEPASSRVVCNDSDGAEFCDDGCHRSYHVGAPCDAGSDR